MLGMGRTVRQGRTVEFELLQGGVAQISRRSITASRFSAATRRITSLKAARAVCTRRW